MTKKILVLRYRFIGDTVLAVPFLRNLRAAYPNAQIDMLVAPKSGEVIENCPYVDNFIYFDTTRKHKYENIDSKPKTFWSYVKKLRNEKYDKAYVLKRSFSSAALAFFSGINERVGFDTEGRGFLLTKKVPYSKNKHEVECFLDVLRADNIPVNDNYLENWVEEAAALKIDELLTTDLHSQKKHVIVHATATNAGKIWAKENFAEIIRYLSDEKNVQVIYIGTDFDKNYYSEIEDIIGKKLKNTPLNFCGEFSLQESLAMIAKADLLVGNDSGNLHMAASVHTKVIGIYGPMPFEKWYALGDENILLKSDLPCMPCSLKKKCDRDKECLSKVSVNEVKAAIDKLL
ncbi:MAG: lipopolysaccharide heptosyltransferase II [Candidatus Gastranaerophilales bacterium]|nr:lipopolysaccharide heptosyltransferase II [Candidatus Gastranaerophilales bacterium]